MFTTILGIPAHPLLIHAAVVFVPLLIVAAVVHALWPVARGRLDWAVAGLAIVAPLAVWIAKISGQNFRQRLIDRNINSPEFMAKISQHQSYGTTTLWWTIGLAVLGLLMLVYDRRRRAGTLSDPVWLAGTAMTIVVAAFTGYYIFKTGDTGAHIAWSGF